MKNLILLLVLLVVLLQSRDNAQDWWDNDANTAEDVSMHPDTLPGPNWNYPTLFNWNFENIGTPGVNSGSVGAMYFQNKFYLNKWNSKFIYRYGGGLDGPVSFIDSIAYVGGIRDLTTDGQFLYGGAATNIVYIFDADGTTIGSITLGSPAIARAIAYNQDGNGFFVCNSNDNIILCDAVTGAVIRILEGTNVLTGKYGLAYSSWTEEGPILWVWGQGTTSDPYNNLWKINPTSGDIIAKYRFGPLTNGAGITGIAGGAEVCTIDKSSVLLLNYQNYAMIGYRLGDALPVELISFTTRNEQNDVILEWGTISEINNRGFEIQRSFADGPFQTIAFVNGSGTSIEAHNYFFKDNNPGLGQYKYRLRQVDFNGHAEYSKVVSIGVGGSKYELIQNYPNPFNPSTNIVFNLAYNARVSVKIMNLIGQEIAILLNDELNAGPHTVKLDASNLTSGVYLYSLEVWGDDGSRYSAIKKMIHLK